MRIKDGFNPDHRLPRFLADEPEQQVMGKAWDRAVISSRVLKASIWAAAATALGIAILSVGNPVTLFADVTASIADVKASLVDKSALQPGTDQSAPTIQSTADVQALSPTAKDAPPREEIAAASEPAGQSQTENSEPASEGLFRQFQAWAAEKDAQVGPVQSVQDAPAQVLPNAPPQVAEDTRASLRPMQKHRHVRHADNARAEMRPVHNPRKKVRREQNSRVQDPPAQEARAQEQGQVVQNVQAPSFLQTFGWRN
jgi:hypothetical protein